MSEGKPQENSRRRLSVDQIRLSVDMGDQRPPENTKRKLSMEQMREYNDAFAMYDTKHKGYISIDQLKALLRATGYNPTDLEVNQLSWSVDYNGNGKLEFEEYIDLMVNMQHDDKEEANCLDAFRAFDIYNRGYIQASDVREMLMTVMDKRSKTDKELIKRVFHLEKDRKIKYEDFKLMISSNFQQ
eukprot:Seg646.1 transcript_id=Seg646.1/GoldUCD/mRNA.D3Y31 product=Calmodulin protein_id=Seg646.1/GoldUCD/D3Y31